MEAGSGMSTPDKVPCGAMQCSTPTQYCCQTFNDAGCQAAASNCIGGAKITCDEKADCTGSDVCCQNGLTGSVCKGDCGNNGVQLCKTNAECKDGTCYSNKCGFGGNTYVVDACSKIPTCTQ
jgi:hypothetical protein